MEGEMRLPLHHHRAHHAVAWKPGDLLDFTARLRRAKQLHPKNAEERFSDMS